MLNSQFMVQVNAKKTEKIFFDNFYIFFAILMLTDFKGVCFYMPRGVWCYFNGRA